MQIINKMIGVFQFVYNFYLAYNGIKEFAVIKEKRCLSRKYESLKQQNKKEKGEATRQNIQKQIVKVQKLYHKIDNIRADYINKCMNKLVKNKPVYITIEDLNRLGMRKNRHLSKAVASKKLYEFRRKRSKCKCVPMA